MLVDTVVVLLWTSIVFVDGLVRLLVWVGVAVVDLISEEKLVFSLLPVGLQIHWLWLSLFVPETQTVSQDGRMIPLNQGELPRVD